MSNRTNYKYIYSVRFANFLMTQGVICRGTGFNEKKGQYFWAFDYDECQPAYEEMERRKNQRKNNRELLSKDD